MKANEDSKLRKSIIALNRNSAGTSFQDYIYLSRPSVHAFIYVFIYSFKSFCIYTFYYARHWYL